VTASTPTCRSRTPAGRWALSWSAQIIRFGMAPGGHPGNQIAEQIGGYDAFSGRSAHHKARRPGCPDGMQGLVARLGAERRSLVQFSVAKLSPAAAKASRSWEIALGPIPCIRARSASVTWVSCSRVTYAAAASACRAGLARPEGGAGAYCPVTRRPSRRGGTANCPDDPKGTGGIRCAGGGSRRPPTSRRTG